MSKNTYELLTTAGFFATRSAVTSAVTNSLFSADLGVLTTCTLGPFVLDFSGILVFQDRLSPYLVLVLVVKVVNVSSSFIDVINISLFYALKIFARADYANK